MKKSDDLVSHFNKLKNSESLQPDQDFIERTREQLINQKSFQIKGKQYLPAISMVLLIPICILLLITVDFSKLTSSYEATLPIGSSPEEKPEVYIYHTHSTESFLPEINKKNPNDAHSDEKNVIDVGSFLTTYLKEMDLTVTHDTTNFMDKAKSNGMSFADLYNLSRENLTPISKNNNNAVMLDIHRDSLEKNKTTTLINNKETARIMFIISKNNPNYESNFEFAETLHQALNNKYPGISRGVLLKDSRTINNTYNQDLSSKALLVDIGGIENTLEEEKRATKILAEIINNELKK